MFDGRQRLSYYASVSNAALAEAQRLVASSQEPEPASREPRRKPRSRVHVILDACVVQRRLRALGLTAGAIAKQLRLKVWDVESLIDYGEVSVAEAERLARALGVTVGDITFGVRRV